jgi:hypothetical protein
MSNTNEVSSNVGEDLCDAKEFISMVMDSIFDTVEDDEVAIDNLLCFLIELKRNIQHDVETASTTLAAA